MPRARHRRVDVRRQHRDPHRPRASPSTTRSSSSAASARSSPTGAPSRSGGRRMATAGRAIAFTGLTVAIGLAAMLFYRGTFLVSMGCGAMVVAISVCSVSPSCRRCCPCWARASTAYPCRCCGRGPWCRGCGTDRGGGDAPPGHRAGANRRTSTCRRRAVPAPAPGRHRRHPAARRRRGAPGRGAPRLGIPSQGSNIVEVVVQFDQRVAVDTRQRGHRAHAEPSPGRDAGRRRGAQLRRHRSPLDLSAYQRLYSGRRPLFPPARATR